MNSRKLIALFLVFALTGSALAAQQQRLYKGSDDGDLEASGVVGVQQHSVFIEIVIEKDKDKEEIHEFAAVVGLIKECKQVRNVFDNAVLWFNDQFLFGEKQNSPDSPVDVANDSGALGYNPNNTDDNPFVGTEESNGDPRWGGCYTPDGFAHAIGADDPFGVATAQVGNQSYDSDQAVDDADDNTDDNVFAGEGMVDADDNMDIVKEMIDLDNQCDGCIFEYHSSFFVVDPNENRWIVDKYVYPLSVMGNLFAPGACDDNGGNSTSEGIFATTDPREYGPSQAAENQHHSSTCTDESADDAENHEGGADSDTDSTLYEPLFTTHLQVEPTDPGLGFEDTARYQDGDTEVDGAPYPGTEGNPACDDADRTCSIEYNFMLAVDFAAFDSSAPSGVSEENTTASVSYTGEDEVKRGCSVEHGQGAADENDTYWEGNSHPHNPEAGNLSDPHCHPTVNLDIFFHSQAPFYTMDNQYWSEDAGTPVEWTADCQSQVGNEGSEDPITVRTPLVCDADQDAGEFHAHDGSETIRPNE